MSLLQTFFEATEPKSLVHELSRQWNDDWHEQAKPALARASNAHLEVYLLAVARQRDRSAADLQSRPYAAADVGLPLLVDRDVSASEPLSTLKLEWLYALGRREALAACLAALPAPMRAALPAPFVAKLTSTTEEPLPRPSAGTELAEEDFLALARRETQELRLWVLLGRPGISPVFLVPAQGPLWWFDGSTFHRSPIEMETSKRGYTRIGGDQVLDERLLYWAGVHVWSLLQRYRHVVLLQESTLFADRGEALATLDVALDCRDETWAARMLETFVRSRPKSQRKVDPFLDAKSQTLYVRSYRDRLDSARPVPAGQIRSFWAQFKSHGVQGDSLVTAGASAGVKRLEMKDNANEKLTLVERFDTPAAAVAAFEAAELEAFSSGYTIDKIIGLPVREVIVPFRLQVGGEARDLIEKLKTMQESEDPAQWQQAEEMIVGLDDPVVDAWMLKRLDLEPSLMKFDPLRGYSESSWPRRATFLPLNRLDGIKAFDTGRFCTLLKRSPPGDPRLDEMRSIRFLTAGEGRLSGYWRAPLRLDGLDAFANLEGLILDCHKDTRYGGTGPRTPLLGIEHIARLPSLRWLIVKGADLLDLSPLAEARALRHVELHHSRVTGLAALQSTGLTTLTLRHCDCDAMAELPSTLERLVVDGMSLSQAPPFGSLPHLRQLELHTETQGLAGIEACPELFAVDLRSCPWLSDAAMLAPLDAVARSGRLAVLALAGTGVIPAALPTALLDIVTFAAQPDLDLFAPPGEA